MKGCEFRRDGIIVPGAGANSYNTHSSRLSTSLFLSIEATQKKNHNFFFLAIFFISTQSRTWIHVNLHAYFFPIPRYCQSREDWKTNK